ncbi:cell adhesion molecule 1-like [Micropterus salmoides]|uniref:cell adhesion molecule 1-like n=1 Tax=Micropterus salmoides TaxID=27706 RepID=UPI0018EE0ABC|nr:cell adhesion molecule 1-like [Micropterus salmoides]
MKVQHTLICFFFLLSALEDGNTGLPNAPINAFTGTERGDITVTCSFSSSGNWMIFCKRECKLQDTLIETTRIIKRRGRYSITHKGGNVFVSITQLTKSDSGWYRCGLGESLSSALFESVQIIVVDAPTTSTTKLSLLDITTSIPSASTTTTTTTTTQSSSSQTEQQQQQAWTASSKGWTSSTALLLYVVPIVVIIVIISGLALMIVCIQRNTKPKGLQTRGSSDGTNIEIALYENCPPVCDSESTYESLDPASRDQNQTYATLTHTHNTNDAVCVSLSTATLPYTQVFR